MITPNDIHHDHNPSAEKSDIMKSVESREALMAVGAKLEQTEMSIAQKCPNTLRIGNRH